MQKIERKVRLLREKFTQTMLKKKGYWASHEEIDQLFDQKTDPSSRISAQVHSKIKEIKDRNMSAKLENQLKNLALGTSSKKKDDPAKKTL